MSGTGPLPRQLTGRPTGNPSSSNRTISTTRTCGPPSRPEWRSESRPASLLDLRGPVDAFFEAVLVNAEDASVRANRYALLARLRGLFLGVADISALG